MGVEACGQTGKRLDPGPDRPDRRQLGVLRVEQLERRGKRPWGGKLGLRGRGHISLSGLRAEPAPLGLEHPLLCVVYETRDQLVLGAAVRLHFAQQIWSQVHSTSCCQRPCRTRLRKRLPGIGYGDSQDYCPGSGP